MATYLVALLMVSTFRYWSFKEVDFARRPAQTLLVVVLGVMIVATNHELFLFLIFFGYALSGPVRRLLVGRTVPAPPRSSRPNSVRGSPIPPILCSSASIRSVMW